MFTSHRRALISILIRSVCHVWPDADTIELHPLTRSGIYEQTLHRQDDLPRQFLSPICGDGTTSPQTETLRSQFDGLQGQLSTLMGAYNDAVQEALKMEE